MLFPTIPKFPPILPSSFPKMHPLYSSPAGFQNLPKINIPTSLREPLSPRPKKLDSLISAVSDISTTEWKAQQQQNKLNANNAKVNTELEYNIDLLEKIEKNVSEETVSLKSNDSIESTTTSVNLTTQVSVISLKDEVFQFEVSITSRTVQIIAVLVRVLSTRFPKWRSEMPQTGLKGVLSAESKGNVLDLYNCETISQGLSNYSNNENSTDNFMDKLATHLPLIRYYCHLRNIELMANGATALIAMYEDACSALNLSVYGDTFQSIPPADGALSTVLDALIVESDPKPDKNGDFTYTPSPILDTLMLKLDALVTERTCQTPFAAETKNAMFKSDYEDGMFNYLPSCPHFNRCCKNLDGRKTVYEATAQHSSCRYAVCDKCFVVCLCQCPMPAGSIHIAPPLIYNNEFSDFNYTRLPPAYDNQLAYYNLNKESFPCTTSDPLTEPVKFHIPSALNTKNSAGLIKPITSHFLHVAKILSNSLDACPLHDVDLFWWRSIEAYYGLLLENPKNKENEDSPLGRYLFSVTDLDKLISSISQAIEKATNNFKYDSKHIDVFVPGNNVAYRRFERSILGPWRHLISAIEFLFVLNSLSSELNFDKNKLSFTPKGRGDNKSLYIYFRGITSCLKAYFSQHNPDFTLTLEDVGYDRLNLQEYEFIYKSIALEVEESLMGLIHKESMQTVNEVGKIPNVFTRGFFNIVVNQNSYVLKLPAQFCGTCYPLRRECINVKLCFTCSGSKEIAESVVKKFKHVTVSLDKSNKEVSVTFQAKGMTEEPIKLFCTIEEEYISECIFQACKSATNTKVAIISPIHKKVATFTVQAHGSMDNAMAEARKHCRKLHMKKEKDENVGTDGKKYEIEGGTLGATDWAKLREYLGTVIKKNNFGMGKKKSKQAKQCQIGLSEGDYSLQLGDRCVPLPVEKIYNLEMLGLSIIHIMKNFKIKPCPSAFLNYFDDGSPRML